MRLLLVTPELIAGGAERDMLNVAAGLVDRGHRIVLACHRGVLSAEAEQTGAAVVELPTHTRTPWGLLELGRRLRGLALERRVELVHLQAIRPAVAARRGLGRRLPLLVTLHNLHRRWYYPLAAPLLARAADRVHFVSAYERDLFLKWGFPPRRGFVRHTGLPAEYFAVSRRRDPGPFRLLLAARIDGRKGHDVLLRALAELPAALELEAWIAGDGPARERLKTLARNLGVGRRLTWLGFRRDLPELYGRVDALVLPSRRESLPLSIREACAAGLPVVAAAVGGVPELIESGVDGLLVERGDHRHLARILCWLARRPEAARRLGRAARKRARREWSLAGYLDYLEATYRDLLNRPSPLADPGKPR
jgi:glycosyltransferase involved in cell wall biosynthesis